MQGTSLITVNIEHHKELAQIIHETLWKGGAKHLILTPILWDNVQSTSLITINIEHHKEPFMQATI